MERQHHTARRDGIEMPPRHRRGPVLSGCGDLVHGVVVVELGDHARPRPLANALVHVAVEEDGAATTAKTRRDGSYSVVLGSCQKRKQADRIVQLRVEKRESCEKWNVTRTARLELGRDQLIWQQDLKLNAIEAISLCEVSVDKTSEKEPARYDLLTFGYEEELLQALRSGCVVVGMLWGFVLLWAVAKWTTAHHPRRKGRVPEEWGYEGECSGADDDESTAELSDDWQPSPRREIGREHYHQDTSTKHHDRTSHEKVQRASLRSKRCRRKVVRLIDDDDDDE